MLQDNLDFDIDVNASVFETNIRGKGCLLWIFGKKSKKQSVDFFGRKQSVDFLPLYKPEGGKSDLQGWPYQGTWPKPVTNSSSSLLKRRVGRLQDSSSVSDMSRGQRKD